MDLLLLYSLDRIDRLPFLFDRWDGPLVLTLFADVQNITEIELFVNKYGDRVNTTIIFYLTDNSVVNGNNYITTMNNGTIERIAFDQPLFPINLLRSLGIHSIQTTHYSVIDIDLLPSKTLHANFLKLPDCVLRDNYSAILFPAFVVNKESFKNCRDNGDCSIAYFH